MQEIQLSPAPRVLAPPRDSALWAKAKEFEACFIAEMLAYTGLSAPKGAFSGGNGEGQFDSFLRQEQARLFVQKGGIGLAGRLYEAMERTRGD